MRRLVIAVAVLGTVLAGCGGNTAVCNDIADEGFELLQDFVDEVDAMDAEELSQAVNEDSFMSGIEARASALDERAAAADCTEEEMADLLAERSEDLVADTDFGQTIVDLILDDSFFPTE
jgi:predicted small secreted protein